jgi:hypothetical protein
VREPVVDAARLAVAVPDRVRLWRQETERDAGMEKLWLRLREAVDAVAPRLPPPKKTTETVDIHDSDSLNKTRQNGGDKKMRGVACRANPEKKWQLSICTHHNHVTVIVFGCAVFV